MPVKASKENPIYTTYIIAGGNKYDVSPAVTGLNFSDQHNQMAQSLSIDMMNTKVGSQWLSSIIDVGARVFVYANDGSRNEEVFRGEVWTRPYRSSLQDTELTLKCYDNLIYFQESEDAEYFSSGKSTKDIMSALCSKWGVQLSYTYSSITHGQLALRGTLSDVMTADVLDLVHERTGSKYVIRSEKDVVKVMPRGQNSEIFAFRAGENAIRTNSEITKNGMVTKVIILGKAEDKTDRQPLEATISGDTGKYGTLQKIVDRKENTSLEDAKAEARSIVKEHGTPKCEYELRAPDVPWIRKGDKVYVNAGDIQNKYLIATSVDRTISNNEKQMTLTLEPVS